MCRVVELAVDVDEVLAGHKAGRPSRDGDLSVQRLLLVGMSSSIAV